MFISPDTWYLLFYSKNWLRLIALLLGSFGGCQMVTITGGGFDPTTSNATRHIEVTICGQQCVKTPGSGGPGMFVCRVPKSSGKM